MNKKIPPLHSLTWLWCSLFAYSVLFGLLQKLLSSVPGLPEGIVLLLSCAVASAIPLLWSSLVSGEAPHFSSQKASLGTLVFLISVALSGNLAVMVLTPVLERVWNLVGFTAQAAAVGEEIATPLLAIYICIVGPVLEELIYRGVVLRRLLPGCAAGHFTVGPVLRADAPRSLSGVVRLLVRIDFRLCGPALRIGDVHRTAHRRKQHCCGAAATAPGGHSWCPGYLGSGVCLGGDRSDRRDPPAAEKTGTEAREKSGRRE